MILFKHLNTIQNQTKIIKDQEQIIERNQNRNQQRTNYYKSGFLLQCIKIVLMKLSEIDLLCICHENPYNKNKIKTR